MNTIPFQQLQAFLAVARSRNFSGAARELGVSRSAVSQSVRQLEPYAASVPGFFLYYPSRGQRSGSLRLFVETIRELRPWQAPG